MDNKDNNNNDNDAGAMTKFLWTFMFHELT